MYSFPLYTSDELMEKYKRQTYLIAFPIGMLLSILYIMYAAGSGLEYFVASVILFELGISIILILFAPASMQAMEIVIYFSIPICFFILTQIQIDKNSQNNSILGEPVYSLSMWLVVFMLGAFLSLKPAYVKRLILLMFAGMIIITTKNLWMFYSFKDFQFALIFRWTNAFINMSIATLLIQRIGLLQQRNATTDALTGTFNRHALYPILARELDRSVRYSRPFSIILFDIDEFKAINDTFGHLEGDKVLTELSKTVSNLLRKTDCVGRWGGEEFLIILPETNGDAAGSLAERIREKIGETYFAENYFIAASFGVAAYQADWSLEDLLDCADKALYQAKNSGRNKVVMFKAGLG